MKLRLKGNSIRFRLTRSDVDNLAAAGYLEEKTEFGNDTFRYALKSKEGITALEATFALGKITMYVPAAIAAVWAKNDTVGYDNTLHFEDGKELHLLLEKDFKCIDNIEEDQSDNYVNPNAIC